MKRSTLNKNVYYFFGVLFIFVVWTILSFLFDENNMIFPNIFTVFKDVILIIKSSYLYKCLFGSLSKMIIGFIVSLILSIIFGSIAGVNEKFKYFFEPFVLLLRTIPTASLVFLFLVMAGAKSVPIYMVILISFPIIYQSVIKGYIDGNEKVGDMLKLEDKSEFVKIVMIRFPLALNSIMVGIVSSFGLAFKIEVMAEVLTGSTFNGLGSAIAYIQKTDPTNMSLILAYSLIGVLISLIFDILSKKAN